MTGEPEKTMASGAAVTALVDRDANPRLVSRQEWWIAYANWSLGGNGPICTECADPMPDAAFVGALVCEECAPYVPESERWL